MFFFIIVAAIFLSAVVFIGAIFMVSKAYRRKAELAGYSSLGEYLSAAPRSDKEKRDAVDLALRGLVICLLGLIFPPALAAIGRLGRRCWGAARSDSVPRCIG